MTQQSLVQENRKDGLAPSMQSALASRQAMHVGLARSEIISDLMPTYAD